MAHAQAMFASLLRHPEAKGNKWAEKKDQKNRNLEMGKMEMTHETHEGLPPSSDGFHPSGG